MVSSLEVPNEVVKLTSSKKVLIFLLPPQAVFLIISKTQRVSCFTISKCLLSMKPMQSSKLVLKKK